jgi:hypothetical protein
MREQRAQDRETGNISAHTERETKRRGRKWRATFYLADPVQESRTLVPLFGVCVCPALATRTQRNTESQRERAAAAVYAE